VGLDSATCASLLYGKEGVAAFDEEVGVVGKVAIQTGLSRVLLQSLLQILDFIERSKKLTKPAATSERRDRPTNYNC